MPLSLRNIQSYAPPPPFIDSKLAVNFSWSPLHTLLLLRYLLCYILLYAVVYSVITLLPLKIM